MIALQREPPVFALLAVPCVVVLTVNDESGLLHGHCAQQLLMRASHVTRIGRGSKRAADFSQKYKMSSTLSEENL
jgi:hypothetical protein